MSHFIPQDGALDIEVDRMRKRITELEAAARSYIAANHDLLMAESALERATENGDGDDAIQALADECGERIVAVHETEKVLRTLINFPDSN